MLHHKEAHEKNIASKPTDAVAAKNQSILQKRTADGGGEDDLSTIVNEIDAQKRLERNIQDLADEINRRWPVPHGEKKTWDVILETRDQRKKEKEERLKKEREEAEARREAIKRWAIIFAQLAGIAIFAAAVGYYIWANRCVEAVCR